jgi:DNA-binding LacI/PurR family transcriptional regulator/DNA-binding transcriptional regulator YhcF (GntR family)
MATRAGVSPVTMWKAVHVLRGEGLVHTVPERQVLRGRHSPPAPVVANSSALQPMSRPRWQELRDQIASDLLAQRFSGTAVLPSAKELCARYGVGRLTLGRALRALVNERRLEREGHGFRPRRARPRSRDGTVVFIAEQPGGDVLTDLAPRSLELWRSLEAACRRRGLRLAVQSVQRYLSSARHPPPAPPTVLGYVVRNLELASSLAERLLGRLAELDRPVAMVDEVGLPPEHEWARRASRFRAFAIAHSDRAGRDVGEALLDLGHRHVVVFSPFGTVAWSRNRVRGLADALGHAPAGGVLELVSPHFLEDDALRNAVAHAPGYRALVRRTERFRRTLDPGRLAEGDPLTRDPGFRGFVADAVAGCLRPLFERALADRRATAWIGVNDTVALAALPFLRAAGRRVPADLSVVGFDDTTDALRAGLASYDFNLPALAEALVEHVVGWRSRSGRDHSPVVEIPGLLVERDSLGSVSGTGPASPGRRQTFR